MNQSEFQNLIHKYYPFDLLTEQQLNMLISEAHYMTFSKNEYIFHEEDSIEDLDIFFLVSGLAKNVLHRSNGRQFTLRFYYPGDLIGLMIMLTSGEMTFSVQALEDCTVFKFNKKNFFDLMTENPNFSKIIFESIGNRMKTLYDEIKMKSSQEEDENITLFRTKVKDLMNSPVFIHPETTIEEIAQKMKKKNTYGLIVSEDGQTLNGIITQHELVDYLIEKDNDFSLKKWAKRKPYTIQDEAFAYEALSYFKNDEVKFVPVLHQNTVVGTLTSRSFLNVQESNYLDLTYKITLAKTVQELIKLGPVENTTFHAFIRELIEKDSWAFDVCEVITNYNDTLYRQIIKITENEMYLEGFGYPPVNYCFIVMGSGGRKEQGFSTDQDNGIIINDYVHLPNHKAITVYFERFTNKLNEKLTICGFPECTGGMMARELKWRRSQSGWKQAIESWLKKMDAEEIRDFAMFYDFRPIFGDFSLAEEIRNNITLKVKRSLTLQQLLMKDAIKHRVPVGMLGMVNIKPKHKTFNLKKAGLMQITSIIRINAIKYGIGEVNTVKRLKALKSVQAYHPRDTENAKIALHHLLSFRIKQNLEELAQQKPLTNEISLALLTKEDRRKLKEALTIVNRMQRATEISFNRNRVI
ncbi:DUF294 nucleotidyltransferase-like domain-containing protein [Bacillus solimangrovi]|uniref:Signal transduction protein n=1 Tax=Bacillus solimangrovi TaxID=1305675 RepID=A0A1E5LF41_9BACI|nr:DUF294 nucleotidyltransferase-like domain-containing protein [Bacillus solimangrovi]OEH92694.1 hypothetical protein BFG57_01425 [Bacillus solimangrovi]